MVFLGVIICSSGCVYYNTFYNCKQAFDEAEKYRKTKGMGSQGNYQTAIDKALKVVENHPSSGYYPEALYVLSISYYYTNQYAKSERRCRELLADFPQSKYAKEMTLYLARAKLKLDETDEAFKLFQEIFSGEYSKEFRAEAALELGDFQKGKKEYEKAATYYQTVCDSLGDDQQKRDAQQELAGALFENFKFAEALNAYLKLLDMKPDKSEKYIGLTRAALCSYRLQRIKPGMKFLNKLIEDELYFDSLPALNLNIAQGYEYSGDLLLAESAYEQIATTSRTNQHVAEAYYRLGLIYQYDYDDLAKARVYYEKSAQANSSTESGKDAFRRAADIAKMMTLSKSAEQALADEESEAKKKLADSTKADSLALPKDSVQHDTAVSGVRDSVKDSAVVKIASEKAGKKIDTAKARQDSIAVVQRAQERMESAANTQFQLAELFWLQLNKPDSAINEMKFLLEHYPKSDIAPRAMIALSQMYRENLEDRVGADSILHVLLVTHPHSDYIPEALSILKLRGTAADTGYAQRYFDMAEDFLVDSSNVDSAYYYYKYVVDHFEDSKYWLQARFNLIWVKETYRSPGDSSIAKEYKQFADSFPGNTYSQEAIRKLTYTAPMRKAVKKDEKKTDVDSLQKFAGQAPQVLLPDDTASRGYVDPVIRYQVGPKGEALVTLEIKPVETSVEFTYPTEAYNLEGNTYILYYQILLDFVGKVVDYVLQSPTANEELNRRATAAVASMTFDPLAVNRELTSKSIDLTLPDNQVDPRGRWYLYKYKVDNPGHNR